MENITIPMEEYKELLIIKGKYEELKSETILNGKHQQPEWHSLIQNYRAECSD